jgi:biopolymer transport protein ExbD
MGRIIRRKTRVSDEIPAASMSDIAFLLLIFFIATTIFDVEQGITLLLPGVGGKTTKVNPKNVMRITTDASGGIYIDGNPVKAEQIEPMTRERIAENPKTIVSIESHPDSRYDTMITVLDEVKQAEAPVISLRIRRG